MDLPHNEGIKEGYMAAIDILVDDIRSVSDERYRKFRLTLKTIQGRAIAQLAMDYLNGDTSRRNFMGIRPTKQKI